MKVKRMILALLAASSLTSGFVHAEYCSIDISLRETFRNPQHIGYRVANLGDLIELVERDTGVRMPGADVESLSLTIRTRDPLIIAWRDVSGYNQNSGAAIPVRRGEGTYRVDDYAWRSMRISRQGQVRPEDIDVNATGSGTVTGAILGLNIARQKCDHIQRSGRIGDRNYRDEYEPYPLPDVRPLPLPDYRPLPTERVPRRTPERRPRPLPRPRI